MKPKPIGIVGGAGPMAGAALLERVFALSGKRYNCFRDADYPKVTLLSYPFTEMLGPQQDVVQIQQELYSCLNSLRNSGAETIAIACNTLHAFLREEDADDLIILPKTPIDIMDEGEVPLVLCTGTSARFALHKRYYPCTYPEPSVQFYIDEFIDRILKGIPFDAFLDSFIELLKQQSEKTVILGCTEFSLLRNLLGASGKKIIDPLELTAIRLLECSFNIKGVQNEYYMA